MDVSQHDKINSIFKIIYLVLFSLTAFFASKHIQNIEEHLGELQREMGTLNDNINELSVTMALLGQKDQQQRQSLEDHEKRIRELEKN